MSLEDLGLKTGNQRAVVLAEALDEANGKILENDRSPQRKVGEIDNRGSHFYLALYWAQRTGRSDGRTRSCKATFAPIARALEQQEAAIVGELNGAQGKPVDIGGYYRPDATLTSQAMRPSADAQRHHRRPAVDEGQAKDRQLRT